MSGAEPAGAAPPEEALDERLYLRSVGRALDALACFQSSAGPKSMNALARDLGVTKSAAQRTIYTLVAHGFLEKAEGVGYRPGRRILDCTFDYLRLNPLVERAAPVLASLRSNTGERADLSLFDGETLIYALRYQSKRETFYSSLPGRRLPSFLSAGGRACMAHLPAAEVDAILARSALAPATPRTLTDPALLRARIAEAARDTYACAVEESSMGEIDLAAAVLDRRGRPLGAVHIAGLLGDWTEAAFRRRFAPFLTEAARALSA